MRHSFVITAPFALLIAAATLGLSAQLAASETTSGGASIEQPSAESALVGKTWQLVGVREMNDTESLPEDRSHYTLRLEPDGDVSIRADCNRAMGSWSSEYPGQLQFGPLAATKAMCPPGSLHDIYLAQFPWIRSYVMKDGNLFLATMADGSIIEFEPSPGPLAATVLGEEIRTDNAEEMQSIIVDRLFGRYAEQQGITATEAEIDAYVNHMRRGMQELGLTADQDLSPEDAAEADRMRREMGRAVITQWKLNRALYEQFGGRIIYQQFGPEPLDAYRQYLQAREAAGDFVIHDAALEAAFWDYFTKETKHSFYETGSPEEAEAFSTPPWERRSAPPSESGSANDAPPAADQGGPLHWQVTGISTTLRLRASPSVDAASSTSFPNGAVLANLGCQRSEGRVWCDVQPLLGGPRGFVAAEFLTPAISPNGAAITGPDTSSLRAGQGDFDASGTLSCSQDSGQTSSECPFGVARTGGGYATVMITQPTGAQRAIFFQMGIPIGADTSEADGYPDFSASKQGDRHHISVGPERYEIVDAVVLGG